jgi:long-chain fatty acid transport protein
MRASLAVAAVGAVVATLAPADARAAGFSNIDIGAKRMAMFSVMGRPDDATAIFHNPAGLTLREGTHFYHSQSWFFVSLGIRMYDSKGILRPDHEISPDWNVGVIPFLGIASDLGTEKLRVAFGIYAPNAYGAALPENEPTRYHVTRALFLASRATASVAYKFDDRFSLGASVHVIYVFLNATRFMNAAVLADPDRRFDDVAVTRASDARLDIDGSAWTWAWDIGLLFSPLDTLHIGAQFASGSAFTLAGSATLNHPDGTIETAAQQTRMAIPFSLRAGIAWEFVQDFELAADVYWWHYQVFQEQRTELSKPLMGLRELVDPKNYSNCWAWNVGAMYRVIPQLELMAGFQMDGNPIPTKTYTLDNPTTTQYGVGLGVRWQVTDDVRLGAAIVRNWFQTLDVQDSQALPPANIKGHGANFEFGFDLDWKL